MPLRLTHKAPDVHTLLEKERRIFAAKLRAGRAVLGWSQAVFAAQAGLTQRAVHKLEQGETEPRRMTVYAIEQIWQAEGIHFEPAEDGFRLTVSASILDGEKLAIRRVPRFDAGVTSRHRRYANDR